METKKVFFHGTNADNLPCILKSGLSCDENKIWSVSGDYIYLWSADKMREAWDCETDQECEDRAFQMAFESAQFACIASNDCRAVVLRIELGEDDIYPDDSSENMEGMGAVYIDRNITIDEIKDIKISNDLSLLKGYFIAMAMNNEFSNIELTRLQKRVGEAFAKAEIYPDDIDDIIEWNDVTEFQTI